MERIEFTEVVRDFEPPTLTDRDVVIDGLFGSGLNRPLTGGFAAMVNYINQSEAEVVAIDIPSGLFGEDNRKNDSEAIIKASLTLTFGFPKLAFLFPENEQYVGEWKILDIGIHPDAIYETASPYSLVTENGSRPIICEGMLTEWSRTIDRAYPDPRRINLPDRFPGSDVKSRRKS